MDRCRVGIVIPALNESATIAAVVIAANQFGLPIVVDDGSTDATAKLAHLNGAVVVSHEKNQGYDSALNSGFSKAANLGCEIVITLDADGQHDPSLIKQFIDAIVAGADVVVGIRSHRQRFAEHLFAWYTGVRYGIKDPMCGMKAYRISIFKKCGYFDSYGSIGTELMSYAAVNNYRIAQVAFAVRNRQGVSRFGQVVTGNLKILRALILAHFNVSRIKNDRHY